MHRLSAPRAVRRAGPTPDARAAGRRLGRRDRDSSHPAAFHTLCGPSRALASAHRGPALTRRGPALADRAPAFAHCAPALTRRGLAAALTVLLCLAVAGPARALDPSAISTETLANGMRVVLWPDHSIPNLAMYTSFRVGSRNERPGITGLSHFFEHMMFNGAQIYGPGEFDRVMEAAGGANNAYTSQDVTCYQDWFPRSALETVLKLETDRIAHLAIDSAMVESERGVIESERRRSVEDNNIRLLDEENWAAAYKAHPYQWPVLGWMVDIENWKVGDLRAYFRTYYAPNNATLVVVGDFEPEPMRALLRQYLEPIPRGPEPLAVTTAEPEQRGERRVAVHKQAELAAFISSWHVPAASHPDYWPLRILESLLLQGESSRLYRRLVDRERAALSVRGGFDTALDPTLFQVLVQVKADFDPARCESFLYEEVDRLKAEPPSERELQKAKNQLAAGFYRELETIGGKADLLGRSAVYFGDPKAFLTTIESYDKVTAADVQRVARAYFEARNRTVAMLVPEKDATQKTEAPAGGSQSPGGSSSQAGGL